MRKRLILIGLAALVPLQPQAKLDVVATTSEFGAIARAIGGDHVNVVSLAKPTEDPHFVDAKPSFILKLHRADALIEGGADLEMGWLPALLENSRNAQLAVGSPGRVIASQGLQMLEVPAVLSRAQGDIHAKGNPHYMVDPLNAQIVAAHICDAFSQLDPKARADYRNNLTVFLNRLQAKMGEWRSLLEPFAGAEVAAYHNTWPYFANRFGLTIETFLEPKPGIPPTPAHLANVISRMKAANIRAILVEPYQNLRTANAVAEATGAAVVPVAQYPGGVEGTDEDYLKLIDHLVRALCSALGGQNE